MTLPLPSGAGESGEGAGFEGALKLLETLPDGSVLCSHGDVIPETLDALVRRGCEIVGEPQWAKASVWQVERVAGEIIKAAAVPPPKPR